LGRQYARVTLLRTLRRRVGGVDLEPYALFAVDGAAP